MGVGAFQRASMLAFQQEVALELFDAHAHLAVPDFAGDLPEVLARAEAAGVCGILAVGRPWTRRSTPSPWRSGIR